MIDALHPDPSTGSGRALADLPGGLVTGTRLGRSLAADPLWTELAPAAPALTVHGGRILEADALVARARDYGRVVLRFTCSPATAVATGMAVARAQQSWWAWLLRRPVIAGPVSIIGGIRVDVDPAMLDGRLYAHTMRDRREKGSE